MIGITYEFFYPAGAEDATYCAITPRKVRSTQKRTLFVTERKENPGKPIAERWSRAFAEALFTRVDLARKYKPTDFKLTPMTLEEVTFIECVEPREEGGEVAYYLVVVHADGKVSRIETNVEAIEELTDDYLGDDFNDATSYK